VIYVHAKGKGHTKETEDEDYVERRKPEDWRSDFYLLRKGIRRVERGLRASRAARISKLEIRLGDLPVARYDRGWDIEPETENAQLAVACHPAQPETNRKRSREGAARLFLSYTPQGTGSLRRFFFDTDFYGKEVFPMATRGRKPTPTAIKELEGNPGQAKT
jgi:hypothetical protein